MLGRINPFWSGAGGFLTLFCFHEILAYHQSRTPKWLGGPLVYGGMVVGLLLGLSIFFFLGIEEPREVSSRPAAEESKEDPSEPEEEGPHDAEENELKPSA